MNTTNMQMGTMGKVSREPPLPTRNYQQISESNTQRFDFMLVLINLFSSSATFRIGVSDGELPMLQVHDDDKTCVQSVAEVSRFRLCLFVSFTVLCTLL